MAKAYWVVCYHSIKNPDALAAYAKIAAPALQAAGGRYLVRGNPAKVYEAGINQRTVVIEFDSVQKAIAAHDGAGYQAALKVLGDAVKREARFDFGGQRLALQGLGVLERAREPKAGVGIFVALAHLGEDARRGQRLGVLHGLRRGRERAAVRRASVR